MVRALKLGSLVLALSSALLGCGADDGDADGSDTPLYRCEASTQMGVIQYRLQGTVLTLTDPSGVPSQPVRQGNGSGLFDTWLVGGGMDGGFKTEILVTFSPEAVKVTVNCWAEAGAAMGVAEVESDASYTDSTITVLEEKRVVERF